jgi:hypothetical protein
MPYCPKCGTEVTIDERYCRECGEILIKEGEKQIPMRETTQASAIDHLRRGYELAMEKPMIFTPAIISGVISIFLSIISRGFFEGLYFPYFLGLGLFSIIGFIISYILNFASIDMSRDAYFNTPLDLMESVNYVLRRIGTFIIASIIGVILSITIILIPVVILMFVIIVIDETGIGDALSKAFGVLTKDLADVILVLIVSILGSIVLGWVPIIGELLKACLNVIIGIAFIDIYVKYKG